jgi:hypothetical protein
VLEAIFDRLRRLPVASAGQRLPSQEHPNRRRSPCLSLPFPDGGYQDEIRALTARRERVELAII